MTILTMGPEKASESIRKALSMGADKAVHLVDDALEGLDALATSLALATVLERTGFDLVILGSELTDARTGLLAATLAERLGVPQLSLASKVEVDGQRHHHPPAGRLRLRQKGRGRPARGDQRGREDQRAAVPVVQGDHGGQEEAGGGAERRRRLDPRGPGRPGRRGDPGGQLSKRPSREAGTIVKDEGDGGVKAAEFLAAQKFI